MPRANRRCPEPSDHVVFGHLSTPELLSAPWVAARRKTVHWFSYRRWDEKPRLALRIAMNIIAPHEPEAVHPCRYRGLAAGRFAAVAHARLAARRYHATRWLAGHESTAGLLLAANIHHANVTWTCERTPRPRRPVRQVVKRRGRKSIS